MKTALVLRHVSFEDLGQLAPLLSQRGFDVSYFDVGVASFATTSPLNPDLVIVLGGPVSVYDVKTYPYMNTEVAWLRARMLEDLPTLGICLGAQLMAAALHARVYPGSAGKEIGWEHLSAGEDMDDRPYIRKLIGAGVRMLHWHGDTFDLPKGAKHLAASSRYRNQAFAWGCNCLALQFHPEFDIRMIERWLIGHAHELAHTQDVDPARLRADTEQFGPRFEDASAAFWTAWLNSIQEKNIPALHSRAPLAVIGG